MIVADGFSEFSQGRLASRLAIQGAVCFALEHLQGENEDASPRSKPRTSLPGVRKKLVRAVEASEALVREAIPGDTSAASTLTIAYLVWPLLYVAHVGNTRAYILRNRELKQLTRDHTISRQTLTPAEAALLHLDARHARWPELVWNCVGNQENRAQPEVSKFVLQPYDRWLLCTDGLTETLSSAQIAETLFNHNSSARAAEALAALASQHAKDDSDITVLCGATLQPDVSPAWSAQSDVSRQSGATGMQ